MKMGKSEIRFEKMVVAEKYVLFQKDQTLLCQWEREVQQDGEDLPR